MLWGGRFEEKLNKISLDFSSSLGEDIRLIKEELQCGKAYAGMLCETGILSSEELYLITGALSKIETEWENNLWVQPVN
jgi:argininosuccinate lyase